MDVGCVFFFCTQKLQEDKIILTKRRDNFKKINIQLNSENEKLKSQLQDNETHSQVTLMHMMHTNTNVAN